MEQFQASRISPSQFSPPQSPPKQKPEFIPENRGGKLKKILFIVIAFILLSGAGAYAYLFDPLGIFATPDKILSAGLKNFSQTKTLESILKISGSVTTKTRVSPIPRPLPAGSQQTPTEPAQNNNSSSQTYNYALTVNGAFDTNESGNPKSSSSVKLTAENLPFEKSTFNITLETRTINKILYFKIEDLSFLKEILGPTADLSAWENIWIKFDFTGFLSRFSSMPSKNQEDTQTRADEYMSRANEINQKMRSAISGSRIIKITATLNPETIEGVNSYHYKFDVDKAALTDLFVKISEIQFEQSQQFFQLFDNPAINDSKNIDINKLKEDFAEARRQSLEKNLAKTQFSNGEIWIAKKDKFISKVLINITIDDDYAAATANIEMVARNFNKPVSIEAPADAKPLEEFIGPLFGGNFGGLQSGATGQEDSDQDGLDNNMELLSGTNPNNPDSDGDGYKDGEEVRNGYNPLGPGKLAN